MNYPNQLKSILTASGWSQEELARRLGVSFVTLNSWVNARSEPRKKAGESIHLLYLEVIGNDHIDEQLLEDKKRQARTLKTTVHQIIRDQSILDKLTLHLTYHTNTIEGSTMTLADTEEVLFHNKTLTNRTQLEQAEARNHQAALLWLLDQLQSKQFSITPDLIKGLHLRLMNGIISDAGEYRRHGVRIMGSRVTVANYMKVPTLIDELVERTASTNDDLTTTLAVTHAQFEKIHPFSDGNGRVGRLLMLAQALQAGITPPLVLKERKQVYYKYLELAQTKEQYTSLELFMAESIIEAHELLFG
jgi:Fic family protein